MAENSDDLMSHERESRTAFRFSSSWGNIKRNMQKSLSEGENGFPMSQGKHFRRKMQTFNSNKKETL